MCFISPKGLGNRHNDEGALKNQVWQPNVADIYSIYHFPISYSLCSRYFTLQKHPSYTINIFLVEHYGYSEQWNTCHSI